MQVFPIGKTMGFVTITMIRCEFNLPGDAMKSACGWSSGFRKDPMSMDGAGIGTGLLGKGHSC